MDIPSDEELLRLLNTVRRNKGLDPLSYVTGAERLRGELGLTSLDLAELTVRIEERFGVDVFDEGVVHTWGEVRARIAR